MTMSWQILWRRARGCAENLSGPSTAAASGDQYESALSDGVDLHVTRFTPESPDFNPSTDVK